jgi:hypothetical protein
MGDSRPLAGRLTAKIAGLEAAFRQDRRSGDLGTLAAPCVTHMREADTMYRSSVFATSPGYEKTDAAAKVLDRQDVSLTEVEAESTKAGVNVTFELYPPSERRLSLRTRLRPSSRRGVLWAASADGEFEPEAETKTDPDSSR